MTPYIATTSLEEHSTGQNEGELKVVAYGSNTPQGLLHQQGRAELGARYRHPGYTEGTGVRGESIQDVALRMAAFIMNTRLGSDLRGIVPRRVLGISSYTSTSALCSFIELGGFTRRGVDPIKLQEQMTRQPHQTPCARAKFIVSGDPNSTNFSCDVAYKARSLAMHRVDRV